MNRHPPSNSSPAQGLRLPPREAPPAPPAQPPPPPPPQAPLSTNENASRLAQNIQQHVTPPAGSIHRSITIRNDVTCFTCLSVEWQQKIVRGPPPPPPSSSHSVSAVHNQEHTTSVALNPDNVNKMLKIMNNAPSPSPPPPPPRGAAHANATGTLRRLAPDLPPSADHIPSERRHDQSNTAALDYDHSFENRFQFTPIEHLPAPGQWQPPSKARS